MKVQHPPPRRQEVSSTSRPPGAELEGSSASSHMPAGQRLQSVAGWLKTEHDKLSSRARVFRSRDLRAGLTTGHPVNFVHVPPPHAIVGAADAQQSLTQLEAQMLPHVEALEAIKAEIVAARP